MDKPRKFIDIVIPFNNEYLNLQSRKLRKNRKKTLNTIQGLFL